MQSVRGEQWMLWRQEETTHNEFNNVQCSLKHSSQPLRRCHSCQISGAEIWLVLSGNSPYGLSAWQHCDPQQMCCFSSPLMLGEATLSHLCFFFFPKPHSNSYKWDYWVHQQKTTKCILTSHPPHVHYKNSDVVRQKRKSMCNTVREMACINK